MTNSEKLEIIQNNLDFSNLNEAPLLDDEGSVHPYWENTYPEWFTQE